MFCGDPVVAQQASGLPHPEFVINSQAVGDTVDVVEVGDDLSRQVDLFVAPAKFT